MLNFAKIRAKERLQSRQTPQSPQKGPPRPITTRKNEATQFASTLVQGVVVARPAATAPELKTVHLTHRKINEICRQLADRLAAASSLCAAERPEALRKIGQRAIEQLTRLDASTGLSQGTLDTAIDMGETAGFLQAMLRIVRHAAGLQLLEDASTDTVDTVGRLLLRASLLAEEKALGSSASLNRTQAIARVTGQLQAFSHKTRASVDLRAAMNLRHRALVRSEEATRGQTRKILCSMADSLLRDSPPF
jgi:hypothetical protein